MTEPVPVRRARDGEAEALGALVARAFAPLPLTRWLVPEDGEARVAALGGQFEMMVAHGMRHGDVYVAGDTEGVAVWFPPGEMLDIPGYDARLAEICGPYLPRFVELDELFHKAHPAGPPHAFLLFLAVEPGSRDRGIGSALLDAHHARLDADGTPVYLDASGPDSRRLYLRHGYTDHAEPYGPAGLTALYPMWREPR
jgi:ribosomal protein S18 acetylase RimI-like enzyme